MTRLRHGGTAGREARSPPLSTASVRGRQFTSLDAPAEVLRLLERGRTTEEIANELHLSRETVRNHVRGMLHALGVRSRLEAVALAHGDVVVTR